MVENAVEYKAKEVILGQFYSKSAEMWSCGVILYKMLTGRLPLGLNNCKSPFEVMQKIGAFEGKFQAKSLIGPEGEIIRRLLDSNPHKRMDVESIIKSSWAKDYKINDIFYENYNDEFKPAYKELDIKERTKSFFTEC
jgi:serine/threonine protein kinase